METAGIDHTRFGRRLSAAGRAGEQRAPARAGDGRRGRVNGGAWRGRRVSLYGPRNYASGGNNMGRREPPRPPAASPPPIPFLVVAHTPRAVGPLSLRRAACGTRRKRGAEQEGGGGGWGGKKVVTDGSRRRGALLAARRGGGGGGGWRQECADGRAATPTAARDRGRGERAAAGPTAGSPPARVQRLPPGGYRPRPKNIPLPPTAARL